METLHVMCRVFSLSKTLNKSVDNYVVLWDRVSYNVYQVGESGKHKKSQCF